jgi:hypothetical protein
VDTFDDAMRIAAPGTENGTLAMMVFTYWEQARAFLNHGLLHEDLFFESSSEFFDVVGTPQGHRATGSDHGSKAARQVMLPPCGK